jgi:transcriptional regulator with XRE-family HTH domain
MKKDELLNEFGARIRQLRSEKKWSQEKLSFATGFHRTYIGMIERGERNISLLNIAAFAKVFELNLADLLDFRSINPAHSYKNYETKIEE